MTTLYDVLNVERSASAEDIRVAYRKLALVYHPDKNSTNSVDAFTKIKEAYDILSDENKRAIYDDSSNTEEYSHDIQHVSHWKNFINDVMVKMYAMASFPQDVVLDLKIPFEDIYRRKCKKLDIRVKRWLSGSYQYANETIAFSLVGIKLKYTFCGQGDDSLMPNLPRGNIVVNVVIVDYSSHIRFDNLFSDHDLFYSQRISLYKFYTRDTLDFNICQGVVITVTNTRSTSYVVHNVGLPTGPTTRSNIYISLELDLPLKLDVDSKLKKMLRRHFS